VTRTSYSDGVGKGSQTRTASFPTATGYVGTTSLPKFTVPQSVIKDTTGYAACIPGTCRAGYPRDEAWYSYWNLRGSFRPSNPYAATMTTTVRFPTTMGDSGPPLGTGDPVTPTTTFDGRYDFNRGGSIMITPGPNRFGGTMQFFYGPNQRYYQRVGLTTTIHTLTGYDNRTPNGLSGVISLVRPRLVHTYLDHPLPEYPLQAGLAGLSSWQINFHFLPEPGSTLMMVSGLAVLAGLYRSRRMSGGRSRQRRRAIAHPE